MISQIHIEQSASLFLAFTVLIGGSRKTENANISLVHLTNMFHARSDKDEGKKREVAEN